MNRKTKRYGYIADLPDFRDHLFAGRPLIDESPLPTIIDLRPHMPPVYDQGELGSCTANAIAAAFQYQLIQQKLNNFTPSRLLIYYNERAIEGTVKYDAGAQIRDGIKVVATKGVIDEKLWPYIISKFTKQPKASVLKTASTDTAIQYSRLNNSQILALKSCLAAGSPFVFGFTVYESFEGDDVARTGVLPMPATDEKVLGGHAVLAVGYDDSKQAFIIRNSWGDAWGQHGYFYMPYAYITNPNLCDDFWTIKEVK